MWFHGALSFRPLCLSQSWFPVICGLGHSVYLPSKYCEVNLELQSIKKHLLFSQKSNSSLQVFYSSFINTWFHNIFWNRKIYNTLCTHNLSDVTKQIGQYYSLKCGLQMNRIVNDYFLQYYRITTFCRVLFPNKAVPVNLQNNANFNQIHFVRHIKRN